MKSKNVEIVTPRKMVSELNKLNPEDLIKDALSKVPKKGKDNSNLEISPFNMKISEQLNSIKIKALKQYLDSIRHKKIKELKDGVGEEMDKYNKNISSLLIKSNTELNEANKVINNLKNEIADSNQKINILQNNKNELLIKIKDLEQYLINLEKEYQMLMNEKKIFDEIKKIYPGLSLSEMILEIQMAKKGSVTLMESYTNKNQELLDIKKNQKDSYDYYQKKINSLMGEINQLLMAQKEEKEKYEKRMNELTNQIELYESRIKESDYLRNSLYYIYNILFEKIGLVKDIVIDKKFRDIISEKDFTPNILYEPELISYIELMVKRMNPDSYDKIFRECVGYLNAIVRNYFHNDIKLRFRPVEIFREISELIENKIKLIDEYKNNLKYKELQLNNKENEINKLKEKYDNLSREYNSYKIIVEKSIKFTNNKNDKNNLKNTDKINNNYKTISNSNFNNFNQNSKTIKKQKKKGIYLKDYKFSFDIEPEKNMVNDTISRNEKSKNILSSFKFNSIYYKYYAKNKSQKNLEENELNNDLKNTSRNIRTYRIERSDNDKLRIENGNQNQINNLNAINELINESNRLFLYRTRMTSFQKKMKNIGLDKVNTIEKKEISKELKHKILKENSVKDYEGKIIKKLDGLISSSKVK